MRRIPHKVSGGCGIDHHSDVSFLFRWLDPVECGAVMHPRHGKLVLAFQSAVGEVSWKTDKGETRVETFSGPHICFVPPCVEHQVVWSVRAGIAIFHFSDVFLRTLGYRGKGDQKVFVQDLASINGSDPLIRTLTATCEAMLHDRGPVVDGFAASVGRQLTMRLFAYREALANGDHDGRFTPVQQRKVTSFIESNLHRSVVVAEMARTVHLSRAHFSRLFTRTYGEPPVRYHLVARLQAAKMALMTTDCTILDVVGKYGFGEQSYLNRAMLKHLNCRPGALIRQRQRTSP